MKGFKTCLKCQLDFQSYWLKDGLCNGCRNPSLIVEAMPSKMKLSKTYETWDETSRNIGDTDDKGFIYKGRMFESVESMAKEIVDDGCWEPSSSVFHRGIWYSSTDPETDYRDGTATYYAMHPKGLTEDQERQLYNLVMGLIK